MVNGDENGWPRGSEYDIYNVNRPRGLFTAADRKYLLGVDDTEPKTQRERNRRAAIRERVYHGLLDSVYLSYIEDRDRARVFSAEEEHQQEESMKIASLQEGIIAMLGFLYHEVRTSELRSFERYLEEGISRAEAVREDDGTVHFKPYRVTFEVEEPDQPAPLEVVENLRQSGLDLLSDEERAEVVKMLKKREDRPRDEVSREVLEVLRKGAESIDGEGIEEDDTG